MNLLILEPNQFDADDFATTTPRQSEHLRNILKLGVGDQVNLGLLNDQIGIGTIAEFSENRTVIKDITLNKTPPPQIPLTLILAMPRPQMLKRILQTVATMGIQELKLVQTSRVEKSFWQSPVATDESIKEQLILGLEQGVATQLPKVSKHQRFRPFVEDELDSYTEGCLTYIAHPGGSEQPTKHTKNEKICLAIGPEGGFLENEVSMFIERGFSSVHLGKRILKVETAVPVLSALLYEY